MSSPVAVDEWTAWAITAMELPDESAMHRWADVLAEVADETEWEPLSERIRAGAEQQSLDPNAVEVFLQEVGGTGQGVELVRQLAELRDQLPAIYVSLHAQPEEGTGAAAVAAAPVAADVAAVDVAEGEGEGEFDWVLPEYQGDLAALWGDQWADYLREQLDYRWGEGWQAHPGDHKAAWFDDVFAELTQPQPEAEAAAEAQPVEITSALTGAMATVPGATELSQEQLAEVMAEVQARIQATTEGAS